MTKDWDSPKPSAFVSPSAIVETTNVHIARLDRLIAEVRADRAEFRDRAARCAGTHDKRGYEIEAAACAIREKALLDARRSVLGRVDPGFEFR